MHGCVHSLSCDCFCSNTNSMKCVWKAHHSIWGLSFSPRAKLRPGRARHGQFALLNHHHSRAERAFQRQPLQQQHDVINSSFSCSGLTIIWQWFISSCQWTRLTPPPCQRLLFLRPCPPSPWPCPFLLGSSPFNLVRATLKSKEKCESIRFDKLKNPWKQIFDSNITK